MNATTFYQQGFRILLVNEGMFAGVLLNARAARLYPVAPDKRPVVGLNHTTWH